MKILLRCSLIWGALLTCSAGVRAQANVSSDAKLPVVNGKADFTGVWTQIGTEGFDPSDPQGKNAANLPFTAWGEAQYKSNKPAHGAYQNLAGVSNDPVNTLGRRYFSCGCNRLHRQDMD